VQQPERVRVLRRQVMCRGSLLGAHARRGTHVANELPIRLLAAWLVPAVSALSFVVLPACSSADAADEGDVSTGALAEAPKTADCAPMYEPNCDAAAAGKCSARAPNGLNSA
jgi:hypothetical protein